MRLLPCASPVGPLEPAPITALCALLTADLADVRAGDDASHGDAPRGDACVAFAAFWGADDAYYVRRTIAGEQAWYAGDLRTPLDAVDVVTAVAHASASATPDSAPGMAGSRVRGRRVVLVGGQRRGRQSRLAVHLATRRLRRRPPARSTPPGGLAMPLTAARTP